MELCFVVPIPGPELTAIRFRDCPTRRRVRVSSILTPQMALSATKMARLAKSASSSWQPIETIVIQGQRYLLDGNHRCWVAFIRGIEWIWTLEFGEAIDCPTN